MKWWVALFLVFVGTLTYGQPQGNKPLARDVFYAELGGNAVGLSFNYEYLFFPQISLRFGLGGHSCLCEYDYVVYETGDVISGYYYDVPPTSTGLVIVMANYITPKYPHHLEIGAGLMYLLGDGRSFLEGNSKTEHILTSLSLVYRYQPWGGGFLFRFGVTPVIRSQGIIPSVGLSLGGSF